jgi:hypothetical protein
METNPNYFVVTLYIYSSEFALRLQDNYIKHTYLVLAKCTKMRSL